MKIKKTQVALAAAVLSLGLSSGVMAQTQQKISKSLENLAVGAVNADILAVFNAGCKYSNLLSKEIAKIIVPDQKIGIITDQGAFLAELGSRLQVAKTDNDLVTALGDWLNVVSKTTSNANYNTGGGSGNALVVAPFPGFIDYSKTNNRKVKYGTKFINYNDMKTVAGNMAFSGARCFSVTAAQKDPATPVEAPILATNQYMCAPAIAKNASTANIDGYFGVTIGTNETDMGNVAQGAGINYSVLETDTKPFDQKKLCPLYDTVSGTTALTVNNDSYTGFNCPDPDPDNTSTFFASYEVGFILTNDPVDGLDGTIWTFSLNFHPRKIQGGAPTFGSHGSFDVFKVAGYDGTGTANTKAPTGSNESFLYSSSALKQFSECADLATNVVDDGGDADAVGAGG